MATSGNQHRISVLTGLNAGYSKSVPNGKYTVGGLSNDTLQLDGLDQTIAQFVIKDDKLRLRSSIDGIVANADEACPKDTVCEFDLPAHVQFDERTSILFAKPSHEQTQRSKFPRRALFATVLLAAISLAPIKVEFETNIAAQAVSLGPNSGIASTASDALAIEASNQAAMVEKSTISCSDCGDDAAEFLNAKFAESGLDGLTASAKDGAVRVQGEMHSDAKPDWDLVRRSFDQNYAGSVPLLPNIATIVSEGAPLTIESVWMGSTPEIKTTTGKVFRLGDIVDDGWTLTEIDGAFVELTRDEKLLRIRY